MKQIDWVIAIIFVVAGLSCLTMASTGMFMGYSMGASLHALFSICLWIAIPLVFLGVLYVVYKKKR